MRLDHMDERLELAEVHHNGALKALAIHSRTKLHAMHQVQLLGNQPEKGPHLDIGRKLYDLGSRFAKKQIRQSRTVRTDDELGTLEQQYLLNNAHSLEIDGLEIVSGEKVLHLLEILNCPRRSLARDEQPSVARSAPGRVTGGNSLLKVFQMACRHALDEITVDPDRLLDLDKAGGGLGDLVPAEADSPKRIPMVEKRVDVHRHRQDDLQIGFQPHGSR